MNRIELSLLKDIHEIALEQLKRHPWSISLNKRRYEIDWQMNFCAEIWLGILLCCVA